MTSGPRHISANPIVQLEAALRAWGPTCKLIRMDKLLFEVAQELCV